MKLSNTLQFFSLCLLLSSLTACSPMYVIKAGIQETKILAGREKISTLLKDEEIKPEKKEKFELVLEVRERSKEIGLKPKDSFTKYTDVKKDVLLWVLSASKKTSFDVHTWWFPFVGRIPYKGFFDKKSALVEFNKLKEQGYDVYLRPSAAFSTLGWFNDPLLSTTLRFDKLSLINTVFHEITHNTIWFNSEAEFNETFANYLGGIAAIDFLKNHEDPELQSKSCEANNRLNEEIFYSEFIEELYNELAKLYKSDRSDKDKLTLREEVLEKAKTKWTETNKKHKSQRYSEAAKDLNNAGIIAQRIYLKNMNSFYELHKLCKLELSCFIEEVRKIAKRVKEEDIKPYQALEERIKNGN